MTFRAALPADTDAIAAFLLDRAETSMFLRANLRAHGPCGGEARNATRMWLQEDDIGAITGVLGLTTAGFVLLQLPLDTSLGAVTPILAGAEINGIFGETAQVRALRSLLGFDSAEAQLDEDDPLYALNLADIDRPEGGSTLRNATTDDLDLMVRWRQEYLVETFHFAPEDAIDLAQSDVEGMLEKQSLMLLERRDGTPVAMTSFNAILPDMVQIGNVYTPQEVRGQGFARRAVALHLERARDDGVERAILFASGPAASRAYEAIGFRQIGRFMLLFFATPQCLKAAA